MAAKKKPLPELNIDSGIMVDKTLDLNKVKGIIAQGQTEEKTLKEVISTEAEKLRADHEAVGSYLGMIRVTPKGDTPIRIEFRINGGGLDVKQEAELDAIFGASRPLLFGRETAITAVTDPAGLVADLTAAGKNPWDYVDITVKPGMETIVGSSKAVISDEAFLPRTGFIGILDEIAGSLSDQAKAFLKEYFTKVLKPVVVAGTKGKA